MDSQEIRIKLVDIKNNIEDIIGVGMGKAPPDFYCEDADGNQVILMKKIQSTVNKADHAFNELLDLIHILKIR